MKYEQRDIVEINFLFPDGRTLPHPAVIVSNNELQEAEGFIYLCLISSKGYNQQYCYPLDDKMLTKPLEKPSFVKCQIIVGDIERDVIRKISRMKLPFFDDMIDKVITSIF